VSKTGPNYVRNGHALVWARVRAVIDGDARRSPVEGVLQVDVASIRKNVKAKPGTT
jgi:hypothetical protein